MTSPAITLAVQLVEQAHILDEAGLDSRPTHDHAHALLAQPSHGPDDVIHITTLWQQIISGPRRRMPRPLCGALIPDGDPDQPKPELDAPLCPDCVLLAK